MPRSRHRGDQGDSFRNVADHELVGLVCALDRAEAYMAARKLVAIAEVFRRNPEDGFEPAPGQMPAVVHESPAINWPWRWASPARRGRAADRGVAPGHPAERDPGALAGGSSPGQGELIVRSPSTWTTTRPGRWSEGPGPGRAADPRLAALRVARAVMEVAPEKARERRKTATKFARVERWAEDSGNAALRAGSCRPMRCWRRSADLRLGG